MHNLIIFYSKMWKCLDILHCKWEEEFQGNSLKANIKPLISGFILVKVVNILSENINLSYPKEKL